MLNDLVAQESSSGLARRLRRSCSPTLLIVDEVGYPSHDGRDGDLLVEVVSRRQEVKSTLITTNKPFSEWTEVCSDASCVSALVDRLVHRAEIIRIESKTFRQTEAREWTVTRARKRH